MEDQDPEPRPVLEDQVPRPRPVLEDQDPGPEPRPVLEDQVPRPRPVLEDQDPGPEPRPVLEDQVPGPEPRLVLVFSGKRKSGKDYVTDLIQSRLGPARCVVLRLSAPLKAQYAREAGLDLDQLLGPGPYKERFRSDMIRWGERRRARDPGFFCRLATSGARQPVWVVGDARRASDLRWFQDRFPQQTRLVRVQSCQHTRRQRGWSFCPGVDDAESECGLDQGVRFDWTITNQADAPPLDQQLEPILQLARAAAGQSEAGQSEAAADQSEAGQSEAND
ncbi:phosphomevalonate kinase isoform 2-T2 [Menidia menidia]